MAVFRIEKNQNYTVMSNHHLQNTALSLKAKGLLSLMLSLPDNWDYTTKGLAAICKDGLDSINSAIKELEQQGYVVRRRIRNEKGQLKTVEYNIMEQPKPLIPKQEKPKQENPILDNPAQAEPIQGNPAQLNTNISNTELLSTNQSNLILPSEEKSYADYFTGEKIGYDEMLLYERLVKKIIEYDNLCTKLPNDIAMLDEIVSLITETVCSTKSHILIAGDMYPATVVKSKLLKLEPEHIEYVVECMNENTTKIRNIKKYLLAALFNAPSTINSYYMAKVNHDFAEKK